MEERNDVILVDRQGHELLNPDKTIRTLDKMKAHRQGLLHLAVSVFVFNDKDELLLQKRAAEKYHSADKWTNTCCTHPRSGETLLGTARRRLREEMGIECQLTEAFTFRYRAEVGKGLVENEYDHVFIGFCNRSPHPDPAEVSDWKWISLKELKQEIDRVPEAFSPWLRCCLDEVGRYLPRIKNKKTG